MGIFKAFTDYFTEETSPFSLHPPVVCQRVRTQFFLEHSYAFDLDNYTGSVADEQTKFKEELEPPDLCRGESAAG